MNNKEYLAVNKKLWDDKTEVHYQSEFYDVNSFVEGRNSLNSIEIELFGNIEGKKILHLQCHFGQDTISLARLGAITTGVDLSGKSIEKANELNKLCGTNVQFIQSDINSAHKVLDEKFDMVFTSYGTVGWHPDVNIWAQTVERFLKPGGKFIIVDFHPVLWIFDDSFKKIVHNYSDPNPIIEEYSGTYTNRDANITCKSYCWNHGMASIVDSLIKQGLSVTDFREYFYSPYNCFQNTVEIEEGKFQIEGLENKIPMLYSVVAEKA